MSSLLNKPAPDFTLVSDKTKKVTLSSFMGEPVVLLFFPFAYSGTCTEEMCFMRDNLSKFNSLNGRVLGISVDSHFSLKAWGESMKLNFDLLSDFNKVVSKTYGCLYDVFVPGVFDYAGVSKRSAFVIDKAGIIRYEEILEDARLQPDYNKISQVLDSIR